MIAKGSRLAKLRSRQISRVINTAAPIDPAPSQKPASIAEFHLIWEIPNNSQSSGRWYKSGRFSDTPNAGYGASTTARPSGDDGLLAGMRL